MHKKLTNIPSPTNATYEYVSNLFSFVSLTTFCYVIACFLCFPIHHPDMIPITDCHVSVLFPYTIPVTYSTTIQQSTSCHVTLQNVNMPVWFPFAELLQHCGRPRTRYLPFYGRLLHVAMSFPCKENIDLWGLVGGFHGTFNHGSWRALHHHAACWLFNIHITWHFVLCLS